MFFYVLYDEILGFVEKNSTDIPRWTFRLDKALHFPTSTLAKQYILDMDWTSYMVRYGKLADEEVATLAKLHKKNNKYYRG